MMSPDRDTAARVKTAVSGLLVVISAPSGAGKTSVLREVMERRPDVRFSVSATTRPPREGEVDGRDYRFVSEGEFDSLLARGEFVEWAVVHGNRYGTLSSEIACAVERGGVVILDTDTVGALAIRNIFPDAVLIFIVPPSPEDLKKRLELRGTETPERIRMRLDAAPGEMDRALGYDYIVVNDRLDDAVAGIIAILDAERLRCTRMKSILEGWRAYVV